MYFQSRHDKAVELLKEAEKASSINPIYHNNRLKRAQAHEAETFSDLRRAKIDAFLSDF